ncbi:MAG: UDP-N-acetylmuramoyl-L-alanine--D-glutamate ligase [Dehalococcoidia bacterium]|nr:UDP-N-acetylmuramoyl-L-alanine--D-glutamate ligase [Dehalococcoidia bacterium]
MDLRGKRVTVVGFGIEGQALAAYLCGQGARVTVSDQRTEQQLAEPIARLAGLPVTYRLGGNRVEDCVTADVLFVSQGVPLDVPALLAARAAGVPCSSATRLFMERCPAPIIGVTGSAGKTTTTALVGRMLQAAGLPTEVGGNNGRVLLDRLASLTPQHWVALEMSHTQLELTDRSPRVALVTNISPSHADRYPDMNEYIALKEHVFVYQAPGDTLVLNWDDPVTQAMAAKAHGKVAWFSLTEEPPGEGAYLEDGALMLRSAGTTQAILQRSSIKLMGDHNVANVLAACAATAVAGVPVAAMAAAVDGFPGVEHRLEWVRMLGGVDYYNDSIATTPERVMAGLRCFDRPVVLLAGGRHKHLPLDAWVGSVGQRCRAVVCFGEAGPYLQDALTPTWGKAAAVACVPSVSDAVVAAAELARAGDVVLLSPACTSFDAYPNFEARGRDFRESVGRLGPLDAAGN